MPQNIYINFEIDNCMLVLKNRIALETAELINKNFLMYSNYTHAYFAIFIVSTLGLIKLSSAFNYTITFKLGKVDLILLLIF